MSMEGWLSIEGLLSMEGWLSMEGFVSTEGWLSMEGWLAYSPGNNPGSQANISPRILFVSPG